MRFFQECKEEFERQLKCFDLSFCSRKRKIVFPPSPNSLEQLSPEVCDELGAYFLGKHLYEMVQEESYLSEEEETSLGSSPFRLRE